MDQIKLIEAYARLKALKANLPGQYQVHEKYVQEFHSILDRLAEISGFNLNNFRVASSEVGPVETGGNSMTGEVYYSEDNRCERSVLMMKIDGVLTFFEIGLSSKKSEIGFKTAAK